VRGRRSGAPRLFTLPRLMRVALMVEGQEGVSWEQWVALADACEEHGIEAMYRSDHYLSPTEPSRPASDAWTLLGALAARTSKLRLGTLVSPVTFRHPAVVAKAAATADQVSGGRIEVGMGAGWMLEEHERFGLPFPPMEERVRLLAEHVEAVDGFLRDDPLCVQRPRPPLIIGGGARRGTTEPAVRFADEYNTYGVDPEEAARRRKRLDEACERGGRDPGSLPFSVMTPFVLDLDHATRFAERYPSQGPPEHLLEHLKARGLAGSPAELAAGLKRFEEAGVERVMLQHVVHEDLDVVAELGRI
jgi:alkanesulfonate monooxygenase SsuD/methylene tetrahydromethanopterin reductase-like flavin-dependent oxidoreductase (luciferase family)